MKHMKTVLILEHEEQVFDKLTCDICGNESNAEQNWATKDFEQIGTTVQLEEREAFPNGGHAKEMAFHICPSCFKTKLVPWLKEQGAEPSTSEADW